MHSSPQPIQASAPQLEDRLYIARVLGVSPNTVDNLRRRGELPSLKIGTRRLFDMADIAAFIAARKAVQP
jgi:excisionase family DNA binding protein